MNVSIRIVEGSYQNTSKGVCGVRRALGWGDMTKSVRRRRRRRDRAVQIALDLLKERGEVSTQELNRVFGMAKIKSSVQFAGSIMRPLVLSGRVEKNVTGENKAFYTLNYEEE